MAHTTLTDFARSFADVAPADRPEQLRSLVTMGQYRHAYALTQRYMAAGGDALDWGCGDGHFSRFLLEQGARVTGYSYGPAPDFVAGHPGFGFAPGVADDPCVLPFPAGRFDAVFSIGVLEHVHEIGGDQRGSVAEVLRVLKPGGRFFVFHLPNATSWIEGTVRLVNRARANPFFAHSKRFTADSFRALFEGHAVRVLEQGRYNSFPRNPLVLAPRPLRDSPGVAGALNALDDLLGAVVPAVCQNWYFVVEKQ
jgi:SAM-dependent methyltransferase